MNFKQQIDIWTMKGKQNIYICAKVGVLAAKQVQTETRVLW